MENCLFIYTHKPYLMKNPSTLILALFICAAPAFAQISTTAVTLNKIAQPAIKVELSIDEDVSTDFFIDNLKKTGYSVDSKSKLFSKSNKIDEGFYAIEGVRLEGSKELVDLYVK